MAPKTVIPSGSQRLLIPASTTVGSQSKSSTVTIPASVLSQLTSGQAVLSTNSGIGNMVVLPAQYLQQVSCTFNFVLNYNSAFRKINGVF